MLKQGTHIILKSFLGTKTPKKGTPSCNNYWKLIGEKGTVIDDKLYNERVLVFFNTNLDQFGVANHNPISNSLCIKESDLEVQNILHL